MPFLGFFVVVSFFLIYKVDSISVNMRLKRIYPFFFFNLQIIFSQKYKWWNIILTFLSLSTTSCDSSLFGKTLYHTLHLDPYAIQIWFPVIRFFFSKCHGGTHSIMVIIISSRLAYSEFKSYLRLFTFQIVLMPLGKLWFQLVSY